MPSVLGGEYLIRGLKTHHMLMFYRNELDRMGAYQFVWMLYSIKILHDNPNWARRAGCGISLFH